MGIFHCIIRYLDTIPAHITAINCSAQSLPTLLCSSAMAMTSSRFFSSRGVHGSATSWYTWELPVYTCSFVNESNGRTSSLEEETLAVWAVVGGRGRGTRLPNPRTRQGESRNLCDPDHNFASPPSDKRNPY